MLFRLSIIALFFLGTLSAEAAKSYSREYYSNGTIKAEGWQMGDLKMDFWIFYHPNGEVASKGHYESNKRSGYWYFYSANGQLLREGHFVGNKAENWWIFYEIGTRNKTKYQFKNDRKNGYCLHYQKNKLVKAERYENDQKTGEWTRLSDFRRDNPNLKFK